MRTDTRVTALYERLSKDDEIIGESNSIVNQKKLLEEYASKNGYEHIKHYTDDGWSGANFDRPSWKKLIADIEEGLVANVIVKDMSRVGRDYLQVGFYTEVMFREKKVHFVAISNGVDSEKRESAEFAPFLNIMNEWYVRDTSKKITTVLHNKGMSGKSHLTRNVIYGYKKDPDDNEHWIIDEEAAEVVKEIYRLCINGKGAYAIARILMEKQIERPSYYLGKKGLGTRASNYDADRAYKWCGQTVNDILTKPEYKGCTVNFRYFKESYKDKHSIRADKADWAVFEGTQEPIVDEKTWELAQQLKKTRRINKIGYANPLTGKLYCADCGAKMYNHRRSEKTLRKDVYTNGKEVWRKPEDRYNCSTYSAGNQRFEKRCSAHNILTSAVEKLVLETIRETCCYASDKEAEFRQLIGSMSEKQKKSLLKTIDNKLNKAVKRQTELGRLIKKIYEDNVSGRLDDRQFEVMLNDYEDELTGIDKTVAEVKAEKERVLDEVSDTEMFLTLVKRYTDFTELTPAMVNEFISKIIVHEGHGVGASRTQEIEIYLNYVGKVDIPKEEPELSEEEEARLEKERIRLEKKRECNRRYMARKRQETRDRIAKEKNIKTV